MVPVFAVEGKLDNIAKFHLTDGRILCYGTNGRFAAGHKVVEVRHPRPRRRFVVRVDVVPTKFFGKIHHAAPRIYALRCKIGAVPPDLLVVVKCRIPPIGPLFRVPHRSPTVVRNQRAADFFQSKSPLLDSI